MFYELYLMINEVSLFKPQGRPLSVLVLVFDETNALSLSSVVDPMRAANRRAGRRLFEWSYATPNGNPIVLTAGIEITGLALSSCPNADLLISVASFNVQKQISPQLISQLRRHAHKAMGVAAVDGGSWALARAGLLDGHEATAHWEDLDEFADAFPLIDAKRSRFVIDRNRMTTGGAAPCLDMMLTLISRRHGAALANRVASAFIYDPINSGEDPQTQLPVSSLAKKHPEIAKALTIMSENLDDPPKISDIACQLHLTQRTLELRFQKALGTSPKAYFLTLRLSEAQRLAADTTAQVQEIALATGFTSQAAFARAFKTQFGRSVRELRKFSN